MPTFKDIISELDAIAKSASDGSEAITGAPVSQMPGAENDKSAPGGATSPDPKVKDETIDNEKSRSTEGAKPDGDIPASNANKYEANEPVLTPEKKPAETADANAKEASSKGNSIVDFILSKKAEKQAQPQKADKPVAQAAEKTAAPAQKQAGGDTITLDMGLLAKIAAITLADEEGQWAVQQALTKRAGAEFAMEVLDTLEKRAAEEQARADFIKGAQDAEQMIGDAQEAQGAADAEAALGVQDDASAAQALGSPEAQEALASELDQYSPEEIAQAVQDLAAEGQIPPEQAQEVIQEVMSGAQAEGQPDEISEEDLAEVITQAVEEGKIKPEDAQALVQAIAEDGGSEQTDQALAADVANAAPAEGEGAAAADSDPAKGEDTAAADAEAEKQAAANRASFKQSLIDILRK